ncbi:hypothetical protein U8233_003571 [Providencia rettgeri]|nr:hypothetical protein [Providencia rettgeri]
MKKTILALLFFPLLSMANTKDVVMDMMRIHAQYEVKVTDWYKKNDTWIVDFTSKQNEKIRVTITGDRVATYSSFPKPITDMFSTVCESVSAVVIPDAASWDENATENTKTLRHFWKDKGWDDFSESQDVTIDGWKISATKKSNELSCVIEPTTI